MIVAATNGSTPRRSSSTAVDRFVVGLVRQQQLLLLLVDHHLVPFLVDALKLLFEGGNLVHLGGVFRFQIFRAFARRRQLLLHRGRFQIQRFNLARERVDGQGRGLVGRQQVAVLELTALLENVTVVITCTHGVLQSQHETEQLVAVIIVDDVALLLDALQTGRGLVEAPTQQIHFPEQIRHHAAQQQTPIFDGAAIQNGIHVVQDGIHIQVTAALEEAPPGPFPLRIRSLFSLKNF